MEQQVRRLVTRSDFDGLACAMMLKELGLVDEIKFVHPKDVQDGKIELSKNDITTNLPYDPRVSIAFDHHESEVDRLKATETNGKLIIDPNARSAARVVYDYYGGKKAFPRISDDLMAAVDKGDSADFTVDEIPNPTGWVLLHYLMDARTGLGRFPSRSAWISTSPRPRNSRPSFSVSRRSTTRSSCWICAMRRSSMRATAS